MKKSRQLRKMWSNLIAFLLFTSALSTSDWNVFCVNEESCSRAEKRIVKGSVTERHSRPFQVALYTQIGEDGELGFCGGSLIDAEWILTAAHCCYQHGEPVDNIRAILGAHSLYNTYENGRRVVRVSEVVVHPDWDPETTANDIALMKLTHAVQLNEIIDTIHLPFLNQTTFNFAGQGVVVSGWGIATEGVPFISPTLREKRMTVLNDGTCNAQYFGLLPETTICAFHSTDAGICKGDNGGPMTLYHRATEQTLLIGIVSFVGADGCSSRVPSVFTRVTQYMEWISEVTGMELQ